MNQMLVLKCFINVYSSMLPGIISLCTFSALHTTHSLCTLCTLKPCVPSIPCGKCRIPLFQPKNRYYIMNFTKLTTVTQVPLMEPINSCYLIIFPKITSVTQVPLVEPIDRYHMVISPKITSVTWVPLVEPIDRYYMVIFPKIAINCLGTPGGTYKQLLYDHFPKIDVSYLGTPGVTYEQGVMWQPESSDFRNLSRTQLQKCRALSIPVAPINLLRVRHESSSTRVQWIWMVLGRHVTPLVLQRRFAAPNANRSFAPAPAQRGNPPSISGWYTMQDSRH